MSEDGYVLLTAAKNEEEHIEKTLYSVVTQSVLPVKWVIVSDGSTDWTESIVQSWADRYGFIDLLILKNNGERDFGSKVRALNAGMERFEKVEYGYIGNIDADVSFKQNYYALILEKFMEFQRLGIAGGYRFSVLGEKRIAEHPRRWNVCAGIQMFRRECFKDIGGYTYYGRGEDTVAEIIARMKGWEVRSFPEAEVLHHRPTGAGLKTGLVTAFECGWKDYCFGYHPVYEAGKIIVRIKDRPLLLGSLARAVGYLYPSLTGKPYELPFSVIRYLRHEQMEKVRQMLRFE